MEKEIILSIEENFKVPKKILSKVDTFNNSFIGNKITTNKQTIYFCIGAYQTCCESFGYFSTPDELNDFIGAELLSIEKTDKELIKDIVKTKDEWLEIEDCIFLDFNTNKGTLQFTIYNRHNGYYGHDVIIYSKQIEGFYRL